MGAATLASATLAVCSWASPGADPYTGDVIAAVDRYRDIPADVRQALQARMLAHQYDDIAEIRRDTITGTQTYSDLRDMHFGEGRLCRLPSRALWSAQHTERGLVYCEQEHCLIVPTVCRNVSRITRVSRAQRSEELPEIRIEIPGGPGGGGQSLTFAPLETDERHQPVPPLPPMRGGFTEPIPEPSTWALFLMGILMLMISVKKGWEK